MEKIKTDQNEHDSDISFNLVFRSLYMKTFSAVTVVNYAEMETCILPG